MRLRHELLLELVLQITLRSLRQSLRRLQQRLRLWRSGPELCGSGPGLRLRWHGQGRFGWFGRCRPDAAGPGG